MPTIAIPGNRVQLVLLAAVFCLLTVATRGEEAWKTILDGKSLNGWRVFGIESAVTEEEEGINLGFKGGIIYTAETLKDFEFRAQLKTKGDLNSGVFIHSPPEGPDVKKCWEVQIANSKDADKSYYTGAVYLITPEQSRPPVRDKEWFELLIRVEGTRILTQVNGKVIEDADTTGKGTALLGSGHISFQPPRKEGSELLIRKIEIRPITGSANAPGGVSGASPTMIPKTEVPEIAELKELRARFEEAWRSRVATPYRTAMGSTIPGYLAAIDVAAQESQKAGNLDNVMEFRAERTKAEAILGEVVKAPSALEAGREPELAPLGDEVKGPLRDLRKTWDPRFSTLVEEKKTASASLQQIYLESLQKIEADLTRQNRLDEALQVRKYREAL
ncbi:MAG: DUF1080 domain-containing protein [Verrucomicrobiales bacterium]